MNRRASLAVHWLGQPSYDRETQDIYLSHINLSDTCGKRSTSKYKSRKLVVAKELYETCKASRNNKNNFLHFFEAVLTVFKSTLNNACVKSHLRVVRATFNILVIIVPLASLLLVSTKNRDLWKTSGKVQHRKSAIHRLPVTLRMLRVKSNRPQTDLIGPKSFSSPEAALLLVSTKNRDLWPGPTPEVRDSRTSRHSAHVQSQV